MKVYELMEKLAQAPAGAELEISKVMTLEEIAEKEITEELSTDGKAVYDVGGKVQGIYHENGETVLVYVE